MQTLRKNASISRRLALPGLIALQVAFWSFLPVSASTGASAPGDELAAPPIFEFITQVNWTAEPSDFPAVRVFADGKVTVHRPKLKTGGGDFEAWLSELDLARLMAYLNRPALLEFDDARAKDALIAAEQARWAATGGVPIVTDLPSVVLRWSSAREGEAERLILVSELDFITSEYPEDEEFHAVAHTVEVLRRLAEAVEAAHRAGSAILGLPALVPP